MKGAIKVIKRYLKLSFLCTILLLLTGCWNYSELEDQSIVSAIGIDTEGDNFIVSVEVVNAAKNSNSQSGGAVSDESAAVIYETKAKTIREALNKMVLISPYRMYIGHMSLLVIGEETARKGIAELIDFFLRDIESRKTFALVIAKEAKAVEVLKILSPIENIMGNKIFASFESMNNYYGSISNLTFEEFITSLFTEGLESTIAAVEIKGLVNKGASNENLTKPDPDTTVSIYGTGVFKDYKLIGYINEREAIYYSIIRGKIPTTVISFKCDDENYASVIVDNIKTSLEVKPDKDIPKVEIEISGSAALTEINCDIDIKKHENITKLHRMANRKLEKDIAEVIDKIRQLNVDVFGFGEQLYRNEYQYWKSKKKNWNTIFPKIEPKITSKIEIERTSSTSETTKRR